MGSPCARNFTSFCTSFLPVLFFYLQNMAHRCIPGYENEVLIACPYNPTHMLRSDRIEYHLVKCKRQHPELQLQVCPFNHTHHIKPDLFDVSTLNCQFFISCLIVVFCFCSRNTKNNVPIAYNLNVS